MTNEITITAEQVEKIKKQHAWLDRRFDRIDSERKEHDEVWKEAAAELRATEDIMDILGIEY